MTRMFKNLKSGLLNKTTAWALAIAGVTMIAPAFASAQVHDLRRYDRGDRYDRHDHDRGDVRIGIGFGSPGYERRVERVWVEPVYRTDYDRVWVEPVYRTECERVWIEPVYETRAIVRFEYGRRVTYHERVLVCAGRWEERPRQVLVSAGCWKTVERRVLVCDGHWDERVITYPAPGPAFSFGFGYRR